MTDTVVVEGQAKLRDGKKWKSRWVALRKPSPVADCLVLLVYKDRTEKTKGHKERCSITLEDICGLDPGLSFEGVSFTLTILCLSQAVMLGFDNKETLLAWDVRIRYSLGEVHRFAVGVQPGTKLESGPAILHLCNNLLVLARDVPPAVIGQWRLSDLRRYGAVPNGFVFEGGTRCGYWAGVFFLSCVEGEQISFLFDCIVRGISPTRGPFGLRPVLPDPSVTPSSMEDRVKHEAQELEKRLSLLSHCSRQSSTASTSSYGPSVASDERSVSSSSSETSHSDTSLGSRLALWAEPGPVSGAKTPAPQEAMGPPPGKGPPPSEESLCAAVAVVTRPPPKPVRTRGLQEIGRQSSSDSGIATGSHSSYSGSFSSYTGSLDIGQGDEFGSLLSLPEQNLCTCPPYEYQVPGSLKHRYDTPRNLLQASQLPRDQVAAGGDMRGGPPEMAVPRWPPTPSRPELTEEGEVSVDTIWKWPPLQTLGLNLDSQGSEGAPPYGAFAEPRETFSPQAGVPRSLFTACSICGRLKCNHTFNLNYITHEQWCSSKKKCSAQGTTLLHTGIAPMPAVPDKKPVRKEERVKGGMAYETMEGRGLERTAETEERSSYELMGSCGQQRFYTDTEGGVAALGLSGTGKIHRPSLATDPKGGYELMASAVDTPKRGDLSPGEYGGMFVFPPDMAALLDRPRGDGVTYVNIPISPASKKQLHYMELELQEPSCGVRGNSTPCPFTSAALPYAIGRQHRLTQKSRRAVCAMICLLVMQVMNL
ncbi:protein Dok-7 isoform X1 [Scleropages formosus]|uniref:protein Dok-7 isoform X1 n=1 Tax=Scleropages formosus TaxID=113540 RepID=UPI0010FAB1E1|nr:protein Dok-7 isoform X1 [Scleropages formosus]